MSELKDLVRPPFANYDVVVYFGAGLFFIPFVIRYFLDPFGAKLPQFNIAIGSDIASQAISLLCLLFSIYILGHLLAYLGSQLIEKTIDRYLGKISTAIIFSSLSNSSNRNSVVRSLIFDRVRNIRSENAIISTIVRTFFHVPLIFHYFLSFVLGIFGYYESRISAEVMSMVREKYSKDIVPGNHFTARSKWFKPLEYYVINRCPSAVPRMYNYLVIAGLFRSLCLIFIIASWFIIYYIIHYMMDGEWLLGPFFLWSGTGSGFIELFIVSSLATFCLFSYVKFQRRYAEEAIMAAVFTE